MFFQAKLQNNLQKKGVGGLRKELHFIPIKSKSLLNAHRGRERGRHRDRERHAVISGNFKCIMIKENKKGPKNKQTLKIMRK